jgi:hypothetical protein
MPQQQQQQQSKMYIRGALQALAGKKTLDARSRTWCVVFLPRLVRTYNAGLSIALLFFFLGRILHFRPISREHAFSCSAYCAIACM